MVPDHPELPTPWNFPFQSADGIHTSNLISESATGFATALTRQNPGKVIAALLGPPPGENGPARFSVDVSVTFGIVNPPRSAHLEAACKDTVPGANISMAWRRRNLGTVPAIIQV